MPPSFPPTKLPKPFKAAAGPPKGIVAAPNKAIFPIGDLAILLTAPLIPLPIFFTMLP